VAEKWLQMFIDIIREKRCVTRRYLIDYVVTKHNMPEEKAADIVDDTVDVLREAQHYHKEGSWCVLLGWPALTPASTPPLLLYPFGGGVIIPAPLFFSLFVKFCVNGGTLETLKPSRRGETVQG